MSDQGVTFASMQRRWRIMQATPLPIASSSPLAEAVREVESLDPMTSGAYFLVDPSGRIDPRLCRIFSMGAFRNLSNSTQLDYLRDVILFFQFLDERDTDWSEATLGDLENWEFLRTGDSAQSRRVSLQKWGRELAAIKKVFFLAQRLGFSALGQELPEMTAATSQAISKPRRSVKWMTMERYEKWRDVGLRSLSWDGLDSSTERTRQGDRNVAFAELLVGTGLRSSEAHFLSVLEIETLVDEPFARLSLPAAIAKGGLSSRTVYVPRDARQAVEFYREFSRLAAVRNAQRSSLYEKVPRKWVIDRLDGREGKQIHYRDQDGVPGKVHLATLTGAERSRLYRRDRVGRLEPISLWLSQTGMPLHVRSWHGVFEDANERVFYNAPSPQQAVSCHPHMLRHTFAMRMLFAVHRVLDRRYDLTPQQRRDFAMIYGSAFEMVRDLLGHSSAEVTKTVYLSAIRDLELQSVISELGGAAGGMTVPSDLELFAERAGTFAPLGGDLS